jgi:short-subunit dehydrogenase
MEISGKRFVVTGGGNGIGREVVLALLSQGGEVVAIGRDAEALAETAALADAGERLRTEVADITDRAAMLALPQALGTVDGLINVAGVIHEFVPISELDFAAMERVMNVNFWGTVNTVKAFLPGLLARPQAAIVNVSSTGAYGPVPGQSAYGASKAAVRLFTEGLYAELMDSNVQVTIVHPGATATQIHKNSGVDAPREGISEAKLAKIRANLTAPAEAGRQIVEAVRTGKERVLIGKDAAMLDKLMRLMPTRGIAIVKKNMEKMLDS